MFTTPTCLLFELKSCKIEYKQQQQQQQQNITTTTTTTESDELQQNNYYDHDHDHDHGIVSIICRYKDENFNTMEEDVIISFKPCYSSYNNNKLSSKLFVDFCTLVKKIDLE